MHWVQGPVVLGTITAVQLWCVINFPIWAYKNMMNVIQLKEVAARLTAGLP